MLDTITTIANNWFGTPPPSVILRSGSARWDRGTGRSKRRTLRISEVIRETPTTNTYVLESADGQPLEYTAGQHLTVLAEVNGETLRRCYSFSTCPDLGSPAVTVKHLPGGRVSGHLAESLEVGQTIRAAEPSGTFTVAPDPERAQHYVMVAGGVGITPLISMAEAILRQEPQSRVTLLYGNQTEEEIIFRGRLDALYAAHSGRFDLRYALDTPPKGWKGLRGALTGSRVVKALGATEATDRYLVCGPDPMMKSVTAALTKAGIPEDSIRFERFAYAASGSVARPTESFAIRFDGSAESVRTKPNQPILEAALEVGVALEYSCQMGGCGQCKIKKSSGQVVMDEPNCLMPQEIEDGYILACCAYAASDVVIENR